MPFTSIGGWPFLIHCESTSPAPPDDWMPMELKPVATKRSLHFRRFAKIVAHVRREAFGAIEEQLDAGGFEQRHAVDGGRQDRFKVIHVFRQRHKGMLLVDAADRPRAWPWARRRRP